jgi:ubiquinone/menaquinone biosynthesis C-methylase UbiE
MTDQKFRGTAWHYARYRSPYPDELLDQVVEEFDLDGSGRLLDLGCGTGHLTIPLSRHFEEVIGLDPEPEMLAEGSRQSNEQNIRNIRWMKGGSFDLPQLKGELGKFKLVTMGTSFHWMDRDATLRDLAGMIEPSGGIAVIGTSSVATIWQGTAAWQIATKSVIQKWLGERRRAGTESTYSTAPERHEAVIARSAFTQIRKVDIQQERNLTIDDVLGGLYSTSFASKPVLGDNQPAFEEELRAALLAVNPSGQFNIIEEHEGIFARLKP